MDVAGNCQVSLFLCGVDRAGFLSLQCSEETFSYGVIPAVSSPTHALREALLGQSETKPAARVLAPLIGMENHSVDAQTCVPGVHKSALDQVVRHPVRQAVTQHLAGLDAQYHCQIKPV